MKIEMNQFSVALGVALPEDPESCRRVPEYTLEGFIPKLLAIFLSYKLRTLRTSVLSNYQFQFNSEGPGISTNLYTMPHCIAIFIS